MIWETPVIEDIACGMEVTAYTAATERDEPWDEPAKTDFDDRAI